MVVSFGYVHADGNCLAVAGTVYARRDILDAVVIDVADADIRALGGEIFRIRSAHALRSAGDQNVLSLKAVRIHFYSSKLTWLVSLEHCSFGSFLRLLDCLIGVCRRRATCHGILRRKSG